jgi:ketosteroid isomerase-like protein
VSAANVEIVRRSFEALVQGDFEEAFAAHAQDTRWTRADDEPETEPYLGIEGLRRLVVEVAEPWSDRFERAIEPQDYLDHGDWVVVPVTGRLHGRGSGVAVDVIETYAVQLRDGKIVRVDEYRTTEEALKAVAGAGSG